MIYTKVSKKNVGHENQKLRKRLADLEEQCRKDPLKKNKTIHEELAKLKKQMEE